MERIRYNHPKYKEIEAEVSRRFNSDFNSIQLDVVEKYYDNSLFEYILAPSFGVQADEWVGDCSDHKFKKMTSAVYKWLEDNHYDEIVEHYYEREHYPMWNTLFESSYDTPEDMVDELYEIGIGVIQGKDSLNPMLFIAGAGYNFYEAHWVPMAQLFGWIDINDYN